MMSEITIRDMLKAGVHFGHRTSFWNPKMAPYIYGTYQHIHILNLETTLPLYQQAINFLRQICAKKGTILFVGTKRAARELVKKYAEQLNMPYVNFRWLGGMLTNYKTIRKSLARLEEIETWSKDGTFEKLPRKEVQNLLKEMEKLNNNLGGIRQMSSLPDALFVIDVGHEQIAVKEAKKLGIPVVGIIDTNNDPDKVDYVIPGNDDAYQAIELYLNGITQTCSQVQQDELKKMEHALSETKATAKADGADSKKVKAITKSKKPEVARKAKIEDAIPPELQPSEEDKIN